jgi:hypothetical protein
MQPWTCVFVDETCPISTEGWTRCVHFVREGGGGGASRGVGLTLGRARPRAGAASRGSAPSSRQVGNQVRRLISWTGVVVAPQPAFTAACQLSEGGPGPAEPLAEKG